MKRTSKSLFTVVCMFLIVAESSFADGPQKEFFKKNYANEFGSKKDQSNDEIESEPVKGKAGNSETSDINDSSKTEKVTEKASDDFFPKEEGGEKIIALTALFDGNNKATLAKNLKEYIALTEKNKIVAGDLILIGDMDTVFENIDAIGDEVFLDNDQDSPASEEVFKKMVQNPAPADPDDPEDLKGLGMVLANSTQALSALSIYTKVKVKTDVPEEYRGKIKKFPTWIVETENNKFVLEGLKSPRKGINRKGNFFEEKISDMPSGETDLQGF